MAHYLERLQRYGNTSRDEFLGDEDKRVAAERYLHLALECVLDLANHVIADRGLATPESYGSSFRVLCEASLLEAGLAESLRKLAGMRNILVHDYLEIDHELTLRSIQNDLGDLRSFAMAIAGLLEE
ncbi:MAG: DUF86 domain-containing protein [Candidatus Wallbacteria bacterium]|nr:DUF86 domain-containing protein [Candidatus Wallbacteria bacterium]